MYLVQDIVDHCDEMIQWRHYIHRHPELANQEFGTARMVAELLRSFGLERVVEGVGSTGVVGLLQNGVGPVIGLRADMDALPLADAGDHDHRSLVEGLTHACGHDGHTAMLLGAARYLASARSFKGAVVFIFQPAEEIAEGAKSMLEAGLLDEFGVESVYAMHSFSGLATGTISITPGPVLASVNSFTIHVTGHGGHAGVPHLSHDPIVAAAAMVTGLQTIVSRTVDPMDPVVVSVTSLQSSTNAHNVIPGEIEIKGTVRYMDAKYDEEVPEKIRLLSQNIAAGYGVKASVEYVRGCPPLVNHEREASLAVDVAKEVVGESNVVQGPPIMGGEDFSLFLQRRPGALVFIGNGEDSAPLHNAAYDFNDEVLPIGASFFSRMVEKSLSP